MKLLTTARRAGKTSEAIKQSAKSGAVIVTHHPSQIFIIQEQAAAMGLSIPQPTCIQHFMSAPVKRVGRKIIVDNLDLVVDHMFFKYGGEVELATMNDPNERFVSVPIVGVIK